MAQTLISGANPLSSISKPLNITCAISVGVNKDKDGNIWFGTATAGAFRYDGDSLLWFGEKELSTLPDGRVPGVRSMIQDKDGYYWLSNFYSKYKINPDLPKGYKKVKAVDLPEEITKDKILYFTSGITDEKNNLWMTTYGGGVWKYDGKTLSNYKIHNGKEEVLLICIYQDNNGTIWLGTNNDGVYKRNGTKFEKFEPNKSSR
ncbi:MAG: two-component regulator propeller domain-containing protein [Crocinitomicaceae bacterium]